VAGLGTFDFAGPLWRYPGTGGWYFISLPVEVSADVDDMTVGIRRGFGSVRVVVSVGDTSWRTSIFPDSKSGTYLLPVKKAVRLAERLDAEGDIRVRLQIAEL
jgi:Domain of unknown function (DUF1905)